MPDRLPSSSELRLSRRAALTTLLAATGLMACTPPEHGVDRRRPRTEPEPVQPEVDPDVVVATEALALQTAALELVRATADRHPPLAGVMAPVLAAHQAHADLLSEAVPADGTPSPSASPTAPASGAAAGSPTPPASAPATRRTRVPSSPAGALRAVAAAEHELATDTKQLAFRAQSGSFARVLGSIAASAAQNATLLERQRTGGAS